MKNNFNTSIDFGSSKIRLGITDKKNLNKNFYTEKDCISNLFSVLKIKFRQLVINFWIKNYYKDPNKVFQESK